MLTHYRRFATRFGGFLPNHGNIPYAFLPTGTARLLLAKNLASSLQNRDLIFCINSGRVGSKYLAELLGKAEQVIAFHEPRPRMTGRYLTLADSRPLTDSYSLRSIKAIGISCRLKLMPKHATYVETNHMFIKVFHDVVLDHFPKSRVILLRRNMARTLKSLVDLRYFCDDSWHWRIWMQAKSSETAAIRPVKAFEDLDPIDRAIAYLVDIEGRARRFRDQYPKVPVHEAQLEEIVTQPGAQHLIKCLGLNLDVDFPRQLATIVNSREELKGQPENQIALEACADRIRRYVSLMSRYDKDLVMPLLGEFG